MPPSEVEYAEVYERSEEQRDTLRAEVERLRVDNEYLWGIVRENEWLTVELERLRSLVKELQDLTIDQQLEIERLRES